MSPTSRPTVRLTSALLADVIGEVTRNLQVDPTKTEKSADKTHDETGAPPRNTLAARDGSCS